MSPLWCCCRCFDCLLFHTKCMQLLNSNGRTHAVTHANAFGQISLKLKQDIIGKSQTIKPLNSNIMKASTIILGTYVRKLAAPPSPIQTLTSDSNELQPFDAILPDSSHIPTHKYLFISRFTTIHIFDFV